MKTIETQIVIEATGSQVWSTLMNFNNYPNWNPFIRHITGAVKKGNTLDVTIQLKEGSSMDFKPVVLVAEEQREFRWKGKLFVTGLFDGEHYFILKEQADGHVLFTHGECFTGLMTGPLFSMIASDTEKGFKAMNIALKNLCEEMNGKEGSHVG